MWLMLACALLLLHYLYVRKKMDKFAHLGIPHQPGVYPFGSWVNWQMIMGQVGFIQVVDRVCELYPGSKVVGYYGFFGSPTFIVNDLELAKKVLIKDFDYFPDRSHIKLNPKANKYLYQSMSLVRVDQWKNIRTIVSPIFSSARLKALMPTLHEVTGEFLELLEKRGKDDVDVKPTLQLAFSEYLARIGAGIKPGILIDEKPEDNQFYKRMMKLLGKEGQAMLIVKYLFSMMLPKVAYAMNLALFDVESSEYVAATIRNAIRLRRENKVKMNDFVDFMLETINNLDNQSDENVDERGDVGNNQSEWKNYAKSKNLKFTQKMTPEEIETLIIGQAFETFISGIDTSTGLASITTYFLAKEQEYQEQVYREIEDAIEKNGGSPCLSISQIQELKLLDAFMKESQRTHKISFVERIAAKDYHIPELHTTIPKDSMVQVAAATIMHREEYYPDPYTFDPVNHFLDAATPPPFLQFGLGPHNCIGMRFGLITVKTFLVNMLHKYKILPGPGFQPKFEIDPMDMNALPKGGIHIKLEQRN